jgi:hypothetical protein
MLGELRSTTDVPGVGSGNWQLQASHTASAPRCGAASASRQRGLANRCRRLGRHRCRRTVIRLPLGLMPVHCRERKSHQRLRQRDLAVLALLVARSAGLRPTARRRPGCRAGSSSLASRTIALCPSRSATGDFAHPTPTVRACASSRCCACSLLTCLRNFSNSLRPSGPTRFSNSSNP